MQKTHQASGILIAVEGIDGAGKSSLITALASIIHNNNQHVLITKEPGGTLIGQELRTMLQIQKNTHEPVCSKAEFLLFAADRAQHIHHVIIPALQKGAIVISDRMADSSYAYQGFGRGLDTHMITMINTWIMQEIKPHYTIYLRIDPREAQCRIMERNNTITVIEQETIDFWQRVVNGYDTLYQNRHDVIIVDASKKQADVLNQVLQELQTKGMHIL